MNGNITSITDSKGNTESYTYDASGNMTRHTDASGRTTLYTYDAHGSVLSETDAKGSVTSYTYYANGLLHTMASAGVTVTYTYDRGQVATVTQSGDGYSQNYTYTYNAYGNLISVSVGARTLVTYAYGRGGAGNVTSMTYANGYTETYTYDDRGNLLTVKENGETAYTYTYDLAGNLLTASDSKLNRRDVYLYSSDGYTAVVLTYGADGSILTVSDGNGTVRLPDGTDYTGLPENVTSDETTDDLMRTTRKALKLADSEIFSVSYSYASKASQYYTTDQVISESFSGGSAFTYGYDALGNLISVNENGIQKLNYTYDALSQLVREDNYYSGKTYIWTYDKGGNILTKSEYAYTAGTPGEPLNTVNYSYGNSDWKDLLTGYNGTEISYDLSGNPLNWRNANALTWDGRRLSGMTLTDGTELAFEYNSEGLRTGKTVGNSTVQYVWNDGNLVAEIRDGYTLKFYYNNGEIAGFSYNGTDYYYGKDSFGVIHYLYNTSGEIVTTYTYDAWGTVLSVTGTLAETVGTVNPVRYKSYYLDSETGWYYLQSRYYDPAVGRFLNADEVAFIGATNTLLSNNLFVYCENCPVSASDVSGKFVIDMIIGGLIGAVLAFVGYILSYILDNWKLVPNFSNLIKNLKNHLSRFWTKMELLKEVLVGLAGGMLASTNKFKFMSDLVMYLSLIATFPKGMSVIGGVLYIIIYIALEKSFDSSRSFGRFNTNKFSKKDSVSRLAKELVSIFNNYLKNNKTFYRQMTKSMVKLSALQWINAAICGRL